MDLENTTGSRNNQLL